MTFHRLPIALRQVPVRGEPHHPLLVEEQNGGAHDAQTLGQCIERDLIDLLDCARFGDRLGQSQADRELR